MKRFKLILLVVVFLGTTAFLGSYFYNKSNKTPIEYTVVQPFDTLIVKKTVASGSIIPRKEVQVKPQVSGVVEALFVEAGQQVKAGQLIAKIKLVPNLDGLNRDQLGLSSANTQTESAQINYNLSLAEYNRQKHLYDEKIISLQEFQRAETDLNIRKEALMASQKNLNLTQQGALQRSGGISNNVYSTVDGILLDVPVKVGSSVIERSNFNEGTTIASIADMNSIVFEGKVDESEVGKIKEGMDLLLNIGAIDKKVFNAKLEYIAPKGIIEEGAIKFQIRAKLLLKEGDQLRAGYSASADIVLDKKDKVMAIKEGIIEFKGDTTFVYVQKTLQVFEKKQIKVGISDGINIEVLSGIDKNTKLRGAEKKKKKD
jgi:HlyD family secretion protein